MEARTIAIIGGGFAGTLLHDTDRLLPELSERLGELGASLAR